MAGFLDGIVFHQILQWHQMLSSWIPSVDLVSSKVNMVWDGLFHALTWMTTFAGIVLLWRAAIRADVPRSSRVLGGSMAMGWGAFNGVEGLVDQVLGVHHVHPGAGQLGWDLAFLASGVLLVALGVVVIHAGKRRLSPR